VYSRLLLEASVTSADYSSVSEQGGDWLTQEALSMLYARYRYALENCADRDVLEVACGAGIGLGYLAARARRVVGADVTPSLITTARRTYQGRIPLVRLDAHRLPFVPHSFDVVVLFEALYYLADAVAFLRECRLVLRPSGTLLLCTVNPEWADFNPSPLSHRYFSGHDLSVLLHRAGFQAEVRAAFPVTKITARDHLVSWVKRYAVRWRVMPSTMRGKTMLKRLFLGPLVAAPPAIDPAMVPHSVPIAVDSGKPVTEFKVLYAIARPQ